MLLTRWFLLNGKHLQIASIGTLQMFSLRLKRFQGTLVSQHNGVRTIILNEEKARNALSMSLMDSIENELTNNVDDESLRCIVLSSRGSIWSAGHNIKELAIADTNLHHQIFSKLTNIIECIYKLPVPVIAKVNGHAAAAGCQLVASCDIVISSEKSSFSTPGANVGVFCSTPGIAISRVMPRLKSSYMVFTGLPLTAQEAYVAGLVSVVVPEDKLDEEIEVIINSIKSKSRAVIAFGKSFYYKQLGMNIADAYLAGNEIMVKNMSLSDTKEGIKSFTEKRKPNWNHV